MGRWDRLGVVVVGFLLFSPSWCFMGKWGEQCNIQIGDRRWRWEEASIKGHAMQQSEGRGERNKSKEQIQQQFLPLHLNWKSIIRNWNVFVHTYLKFNFFIIPRPLRARSSSPSPDRKIWGIIRYLVWGKRRRGGGLNCSLPPFILPPPWPPHWVPRLLLPSCLSNCASPLRCGGGNIEGGGGIENRELGQRFKTFLRKSLLCSKRSLWILPLRHISVSLSLMEEECNSIIRKQKDGCEVGWAKGVSWEHLLRDEYSPPPFAMRNRSVITTGERSKRCRSKYIKESICFQLLQLQVLISL